MGSGVESPAVAADPSPLAVVEAEHSEAEQAEVDVDVDVDVDTGIADRAAVAAMVAQARIDGAATVRTRHPQAARRAAAVIDAIVAAGDTESEVDEGPR